MSPEQYPKTVATAPRHHPNLLASRLALKNEHLPFGRRGTQLAHVIISM